MNELNRDLLVAVLALLTDAIPRAHLSAALSAWSKDRKQSLAQHLLRDGVLDGDRLRALECLAEAHLKGHCNDLRLCLDAWNAQGLTQEVLTEIGDAALCTTLGMSLGGDSTLPVARGDEQAGKPPDAGAPPQFTQGERFLPIRPHARGGLGQVWVARDCELQREVALKEIQPRYAQQESQRARFLLEAEITGNLEHPGIVPVYSLGRHGDGRPYYAMRFIRGESLQAAIRQFHLRFGPAAGAPANRSRSIWGMEFRQLLGRFLDVCDAMDYAHSRGVLHRDLKPANIMLGRYGETLVVDWGLAKVIGKADIRPARAEGDFEPGLAVASGTLSGDTQPGTTIGTPAYMSPEQARGAIAELGPASDVYSLGATLYEVLTGQVAFPGETARAVIEQVLKGDFPPPHAVLRSVPVPLEAICLKAMATRPQDRYASVRALARDLEHWLADEPVAAYPERRLERWGRWLRQHRTWTYAALAALIGISLAASIGVVVVDRARRREAEVRQEAQTNFLMAQQAVEDYLTSVSQNTLLKEQDSVDIRSLRRELLETALKYYERFVNQRSHDPHLRQELAHASFRVGMITQEIGSLFQAIEAFRSARTIWNALAAADPEDPALQRQQADCSLEIGKLWGRTGDLQAAMTALAQARAILERLVARQVDWPTDQARLARCYSETGTIQARLGSSDQGREMLEKAKAIQHALIRRSPGEIGYQKSLAEMINVQGFVAYKRRDYAAALRSFQEVQNLCESLLERLTAGPKPVWLLDLLALSHYNIATIRYKNGELEAALHSFERSLDYRAALVAAHPSVTRFQEELGRNSREVAHVLHEAHHEDKALASIQKSLQVLEGLVRSQPEPARYHSELGRSYNTLGHLYDEARDNVRAMPEFQRAVTEQQLAADKAPDVDEYKAYLCNHLDNLAEQSVDLGRVEQALPYYERAIGIRRKLLAAHEGSREYTLGLAEGLSALGSIRRHAGESASARELFAEARAVLEPAAAAAPGDAGLQGRLGAILTLEAVARADLGQRIAALDLLGQAVEKLRPIGSAPTADSQEREWLTESLWEQSRLLQAAQQAAEADRLTAERSNLWNDRPPAELAALALRQASRAALIGYGKTPISRPGQAVRDLDLDQAAADLSLAIARGFKDLAMLRAHPDSSALLARVDLRPLIQGLELPDQPAGPRSRPD